MEFSLFNYDANIRNMRMNARERYEPMCLHMRAHVLQKQNHSSINASILPKSMYFVT